MGLLDLERAISTASAAGVRKALGELTALEERNRLLFNQQLPPEPSTAVLIAWRNAVPGPVRCGCAIQPSAHEVILFDGTGLVSQLSALLFLDDDDRLVAEAREIFDSRLDLSDLAALETAVMLESTAAAAVVIGGIQVGG